ncbi:peptidyl-prolyl cis-trans isomerase [Halanaerobiaceae bacterium Z-7014]|uniref:Peptidyl-prolyl cis-trans isomerase n=1 Tax=Halonatronomonas betaini TaxID=2778430 RepID=A0A931ATH4_9FIRM|nr:peptidyl-prolyl cis-trans isomerase [Halonatronomonas betaini]MBF8437884.1 peptidyl-prolyl cis-trans isomerase [Halonatronomonas betaini]
MIVILFKKFSVIVLIGFLAVTLLTGSVVSAQEMAEDELAAIVNGEEISILEIDEFIGTEQVVMQIFQTNQEFGQLLLQTEAGHDLMNEYRKMKFDEFLTYYLLNREVEEKGLEMTDDDKDEFFDDHLELVMAQNNMNEQELLQVLQQQGIQSLDEYKEMFLEMNEQDMLIFTLQEETVGTIEITEEEMQEYYDNNQSQFEVEAGSQVRHILLDTEEEAGEVLERLNAGEDFAELAREVSTCPSADQGGELGVVNEGTQFDQTFKDAALSLDTGEVSEIVATDFGYHIIKVDDIVEAGLRDFSEVRDEIEAILLDRERQVVWQEYVEELMENAEVENKL